MKDYDVQSIDLGVPLEIAFSAIADPDRLPHWTLAFATVGQGRATLRTPTGRLDIGLEVRASREAGTVDWLMTLPDGSTAIAYSRVTPLGTSRCVFSFVLPAPPGPLERLEGALEAQSRTLAQELVRLKQLVETETDG